MSPGGAETPWENACVAEQPARSRCTHPETVVDIPHNTTTKAQAASCIMLQSSGASVTANRLSSICGELRIVDINFQRKIWRETSEVTSGRIEQEVSAKDHHGDELRISAAKAGFQKPYMNI
jgi:hypothetical protein